MIKVKIFGEGVDMKLLECFFYGLISGLTEIVPVSAVAHRVLLGRLMGIDEAPAAACFLLRLVVMIMLLFCCRHELAQVMAVSRRGRQLRRSADFLLLRTAAVPLLLGFFLLPRVSGIAGNLPLLSLMLLVNGLILYIPGRMLQGNKRARAMSPWDGMLMGVLGIAGVVPGISRVGTLTSVAIGRGADKQQALKWALLLSIPALAVLMVMDLVSLFGGAPGAAFGFVGTLLAAMGAAAGSFAGIRLLRYLAVKTGFSGLAFYSWGAALFSFVMYLTVV